MTYHLFCSSYSSCLQSWLEQDPSCPTCRLALSVQQPPPAHASGVHPAIDRIEEPENARRGANNHFFQFNGSRYVSWLPTFSVEVTHINSVFRVGGPRLQATAAAAQAHTSQVRNMAHQVQQMFPAYALATIIADLQQSRSMEVTIDNILEGRLPVPAAFRFGDEHDDEHADRTTGDAGAGNVDVAAGIVEPLASTSSASGAATERNAFMASASSAASSSSNSLDSGYEIERNSNIFGNQNELLRDERWVKMAICFCNCIH